MDDNLKFVIGLITLSSIATILFFQIFKAYNKSFIEVDEQFAFNIIVNTTHYMNGSMYVNGEYSLPLLFDENRICLCDEIRKGDMIIKEANDSLYHRVRGQDTLTFRK